MSTLDWLERLIQFDTTSKWSNLELIECLANELEDKQIKPILIYDKKAPKANLLATIAGANGAMTHGLVLSGHTDVVPVEGQAWETDPFQAVIKENKVFGRGACDMKGFIAVVMGLIPKIKAMTLDFPVHLAFSYDEEIGCLGAPYLIDKIKALDYEPAACIVGEPTLMKPVIGHKGKRTYRCQVKGVAAHSSLTPNGLNAIEYGAQLIHCIHRLAVDYKEKGVRDFSYDVPYTTLATTMIQGGNAYNTIPEWCEFIFEYRNLAKDSPLEIHQAIIDSIQKDLIPEMQRNHRAAKIDLDIIADAPGLDMESTAPLVRAVQSAVYCDHFSKVAYATEAGLFQQAKIPTVVCGPGSIEQAHCANEYVALEQLRGCESFILELLRSWKSPLSV